jgi:hypothetical protein
MELASHFASGARILRWLQVFFFSPTPKCSVPEVKVAVCVEDLENHRTDINIDTGNF